MEKEMATRSSILSGEFRGLYRPWGGNELDTTEQLSLHFNAKLQMCIHLYLVLITFQYSLG